MEHPSLNSGEFLEFGRSLELDESRESGGSQESGGDHASREFGGSRASHEPGRTRSFRGGSVTIEGSVEVEALAAVMVERTLQELGHCVL